MIDTGEGRPSLVGQQLGSYRILSLLGAGGMGEVYRALDTNLNRPVAIKFLSEDLADTSARRRFQREAQLASSLNHPHILTVHDAGEFEGRQYLVTEFVDGGTLTDWARREKRTWRQVVELLVGVADGLAAAHAAGILHRDIKPENVLVAKNGYAKVSDFGLAKLEKPSTPEDVTRTVTDGRTRPGVIVGTIAYMSPEPASGKPMDARSDIFSFGAFDYFRQATEKDPGYAAAHAALADHYLMMINLGRMSAKETYPKSRAAVTRALQLDDALAEAHSSLADLLQYHDWNWGEAEREYQRAIQLNPNFAFAHLWYSDLLATTGRHDEAIVEGRRALQLDPYSYLSNYVFGQTLLMARRNDEAIKQARKTLDQNLDPVQAASHKIIGLAYEQKGDLEQAISELQQALKLLSAGRGQTRPNTLDEHRANLAHAYAVSGRKREALQFLAELTETSKRRPVSSWAFATIYTGLGDKDRAFESLEKGYDERPSGMSYLKVEPRMDPLRSNPRYHELLRRMGLPP